MDIKTDVKKWTYLLSWSILIAPLAQAQTASLYTPQPYAAPIPPSLARDIVTYRAALDTYLLNPIASTQTALSQALSDFQANISAGQADASLDTLSLSANTTINGLGGASQREIVNAYDAGSIDLQNGATLTIKDNVASGTGGGWLNVGNDALFALTADATSRYTITNNSSNDNGGAIHSDNGNLYITYSDFTTNHSDSSGGAISNDVGTLYLADSEFGNNTADFSGGAIYNNFGSIQFVNIYFNNNSTDFYGGAIENDNGNIYILGASFTSNTSNDLGGAIDNNQGKLVIENTLFTDNYALNKGGAINSQQGTITLTNTSFTKNTADGDGGALYLDGSELNIKVTGGSTSLFSGNIANATANALFIDTMSDNSVLNVTTDANSILDMRDPLAGDANSSQTITVNKNGTGEWKLAGHNHFITSDNSSDSRFNVNQGTLYLYHQGEIANASAINPAAVVDAGAITLEGTNAIFTLNAGATLAAGGGNTITTDDSIVLEKGATLSFDAAHATDNGGTPSATNAVLNLVAANGVSITGTGQLNIDLLSLNAANGNYTLLYNSNNAADSFSTANVNANVTLLGQSTSANSRISSLSLSVNPDNIVLNQNSTGNDLATWTNAAANSIWDINEHNWQLTISGTNYTQYLPGDAVRFDDTVRANQQITVNSGGVLVAGMEVDSQYDYTFNGGAIVADITATTITNPALATGELYKLGSGKLTLNNSFTGNVNLRGGSLIVGDSTANSSAIVIGDIQAGLGTLLGGYGQIQGSVNLLSGSTIAPGNSIGTLMVGNITFNLGATYEVEALSNGLSDRINVTGTAIINGGDISVLAGAGLWSANTSYVIIDAPNNPITGTFDNLNTNLAFLTPSLDYTNPNQVKLTLTRSGTSFANVGITYNQINTGNAIESLGSSHPVYNNVVGMSALQAQRAFNNLSGEIYASAKSALFSNSYYSRSAIYKHLNNQDSLLTNVLDTNKHLWIDTWYHNGYLKDDSNADRLNNRGQGILIGADMLSNDTSTLGVALGYELTNLSIGGDRASKADIDAIHVLGYARTSINALDLKGGVGYSWLDVDSKRDISLGSATSKNKANYRGQQWQLFTETSHSFQLNTHTQLSPYVNLTYQQLKFNNFNEKGSLGTLHSKKQTAHQLQSAFGSRAEFTLTNKASIYTDLAWQHNFGKRTPDTKLRFHGGVSDYKIKGIEMNKNNALVGVGANFQLADNINLNLGYEGQYGNRSKDHAVRGKLEIKF